MQELFADPEFHDYPPVNLAKYCMIAGRIGADSVIPPCDANDG
jgi:hypothetical protein